MNTLLDKDMEQDNTNRVDTDHDNEDNEIQSSSDKGEDNEDDKNEIIME